jgi:hypothetical protein
MEEDELSSIDDDLSLKHDALLIEGGSLLTEGGCFLIEWWMGFVSFRDDKLSLKDGFFFLIGG